MSLRKVVLHLAMCLFTVLDLLNQPASCLGKISNAAGHKAFPPQMLLAICTIRSLSCANAHEYTDFSSRPFVTDSLIKDHGRRVVFAGAFVEENRLSNLNGFKSQRSSACRSSSLPDTGVWFHWRFFARIVGAEENLAGARFLGAFVDCCDGSEGC